MSRNLKLEDITRCWFWSLWLSTGRHTPESFVEACERCMRTGIRWRLRA